MPNSFVRVYYNRAFKSLLISTPRANLHSCDGISPTYFSWVKESTIQHQMTYPLFSIEVEDDIRWSTIIQRFDKSLLATFRVVKHLTTVLGQTTKISEGVDLLVIQAAITFVQARTLVSGVMEGEKEQKRVNKLCCLGIQIYLITIARHLSLAMDLNLSSVLSGLRNCLSDVSIETASCHHLLLWVVFCGGMVIHDNKDRSWFMARLRQITQILNLYDWQTLRLTLKGFLWVDNLHDMPGRLLWDVAVEQSYLELNDRPYSN